VIWERGHGDQILVDAQELTRRSETRPVTQKSMDGANKLSLLEAAVIIGTLDMEVAPGGSFHEWRNGYRAVGGIFGSVRDFAAGRL
jgi:hypothetical protein